MSAGVIVWTTSLKIVLIPVVVSFLLPTYLTSSSKFKYKLDLVEDNLILLESITLTK